MSEVSEIAPGEELEWEPLQGKTACRIAVYRPESSIFASEGAQDEMLRWSIERLLKFKEVFGPRLQSAVLKAEERLAAAAPEDTEAAELLDRPSDWDSSVLNGRLLGMLVWLRAFDLGASAAAVASRFGVPVEEGPVA